MVASVNPRTTNWTGVNWRRANRVVRNLRYRIFKATQRLDWKRVRGLQRLMLKSYSALLLAVRRVTQVNRGKTTSGIDHLLVLNPKGRGYLVDVLKRFIPWKPLPSKRVYIPKSGKKKRPLGIPSIIDRCLQAVVKSALEPCWEAQFEGCSYGFRPGRSAHDALSKIFNVARPSSNKRWILDADITGCFDNIDHEHLMVQLKGFPARKLIYQWLKAGYLEKGTYMPTNAGTPQGGVISPLLANIALHGMEDALGVVKPTGTTVRTPRILVRYADDLVVFCRTEADARQAREELSGFLGKRGLELSNEKTSIVQIETGFNFLGFNVRQYRDLTSKTGFKLLIKPSKKSIQTFKVKVRDVFLSCNGLSAATLINKVNPIVRGWCNYYLHVVSSEVFNKLNTFLYHRCYRYAKRQHPNKSHKWRRAKYWGQSKTDLIGKSFMDKGVTTAKLSRSASSSKCFLWLGFRRQFL